MNQQLSRDELYKIKSTAVHSEALNAAATYQKSESYLLLVIEVVNARRLFEDCELTSLYQYCTRILNLSEALSYSLIAVIRRSEEVPQLKEAVLSGKITLSKAKKICSVITAKNHKEWIELAASETSRVIEKCVAQANPKECVIESAKYKTGDRIEFKLGVSEEFIELLKNAKDLLSQKQSIAVSSEEALMTALQELIEKHDPMKKAERTRARSEKKANEAGALLLKTEMKEIEQKQQFPGPVATKAIGRASLPAVVKHAVTLRDLRQCTHIYRDGSRCECTRWLDVHHIVPVSRGGTNDVNNLKTLCSAHHRMMHHQLEN